MIAPTPILLKFGERAFRFSDVILHLSNRESYVPARVSGVESCPLGFDQVQLAPDQHGDICLSTAAWNDMLRATTEGGSATARDRQFGLDGAERPGPTRPHPELPLQRPMSSLLQTQDRGTPGVACVMWGVLGTAA